MLAILLDDAVQLRSYVVDDNYGDSAPDHVDSTRDLVGSRSEEER